MGQQLSKVRSKTQHLNKSRSKTRAPLEGTPPPDGPRISGSRNKKRTEKLDAPFRRRSLSPKNSDVPLSGPLDSGAKSQSDPIIDVPPASGDSNTPPTRQFESATENPVDILGPDCSPRVSPPMPTSLGLNDSRAYPNDPLTDCHFMPSWYDPCRSRCLQP